MQSSVSIPTSNDIYITHLGMFDKDGDGLVNTHSVGLWSDSGTLLSSAVLTPNDPGILIDGFRYKGISQFFLNSVALSV